VLNKIHDYAEAYTTSTAESVGADYCAEFVEDAPSVLPTTEQSSMVGEWKKEVNEKLGKCLRVVYVCSACGCAVGCESFHRRSYCPNCGAKMKSEE
jgi:rubrerythrin